MQLSHVLRFAIDSMSGVVVREKNMETYGENVFCTIDKFQLLYLGYSLRVRKFFQAKQKRPIKGHFNESVLLKNRQVDWIQICLNLD